MSEKDANLKPVLKHDGPPPPPPADMGDGTRRVCRRGSFSYAQHEKLNARLYVREGDGERQAWRLPSLTGKVALSETGGIFITDKKNERVIEVVDGAKNVVFAAEKGDRVAQMYAAGPVVWIWEGPNVGAGIKRAQPEHLHRLAKRNGAWETTHSGLLPLKATSFGGNETTLAVLNEGGSVTVIVASSDDSTLLDLGTHDKNFTDAMEWNGDVLLVSHWEPDSAWLVTGRGATTAQPSSADLGLHDLPGGIRCGIEQQLRDGAIDLIHQARSTVGSSWTQSRRDQHMRKAGASTWAAVKDDVMAELARLYELEPSPKLQNDLERFYAGHFEDAASWHDSE